MIEDGYLIAKSVITESRLREITDDLLGIALALTGIKFTSVDECWNHFKLHDRELGGCLYNGFKRLPSVYSLAVSSEIIDLLKSVGQMKHPALVDLNCRIDSRGDSRYLFDWHQDYWFSMSSTQAFVLWIPLHDITNETGCIEVIPVSQTRGQIMRTKKGGVYYSYADAVKLDDSLVGFEGEMLADRVSRGDEVLFGFNVLHRSVEGLSDALNRFTVQVRYADFFDSEFIHNKYRPGLVGPEKTDYLEK